MMMHIVFDRATASVLNITWGFIIALSAISILALKNLRPDPNFFYFVVVVSFTVGLFNLMFGLATVSHAIKAYQDIRTEEKVKKFEQIFLSSKFIIYPPLLLLAPVINILTKESVFFLNKYSFFSLQFRAIFRHNKFVLTQVKTCSMAQSIFASSPQLALQVRVEWRPLIGPSPSIYCALICGDHNNVMSLMSQRDSFGCLSLC